MLITAREKGQGLVEYALIILLIALAVFIAVQLFGEALIDTYNTIITALNV